MYEKSPPEIGIIGAGMSGICAAIQLQKKLNIKSFTLFEKNRDIGGTWYKNVYPGCACDIPSHVYSFSFELNPNWTTNYASQPEILDYLRNVCTKHAIYDYIKFQHEVKTITWDEKLMKWIVQYVNLSLPDAVEETIMFDIIIDAPGGLVTPSIPKQFTSFEGPIMHTAEWDLSIGLQNKQVAIVGSGASAVQVIPNIVGTVASLHCYQRTPPYVLPKIQFTYWNFVKRIFLHVPIFMWIARCVIFILYEIFFSALCPGTILQNLFKKWSKRFRQNQLKGHPKLYSDVTPQYTFGCKRVTISENYYSAMIQPNVRLHTCHIEKIDGRTIYTKDGNKQEIDVLILATGFRVQEFFVPMKVFGKDGVDIRKMWMEDTPRSYYGIISSAMPNHFMVLGPNTSLGHNSVVFMMECQINFIMKTIREMMNRNAKCVKLKVSAEDKFMERLRQDLKKTVWGQEDCGSWYANSRGITTTQWSNNCTNYWRRTKRVDWSKFDFI